MAEPTLKASTGMQLEIELLSRSGENEKLSLRIVPDQEADFARGLLSEMTPLAKLLLGHSAGETLPYQREELYAVRILSIRRDLTPAPADPANQRRAEYEQAVREAERANAVNFASSFSGKWGDYDPDSLPKDP